jgi:hypothetical protein
MAWNAYMDGLYEPFNLGELGDLETAVSTPNRWAEAKITALGAEYCANRWNLSGTPLEAWDAAWSKACREYNRGAHEQLCRRILWRAYRDGQTIGHRDLSDFSSPDSVLAARDTWADANIQALGAGSCAKEWGLSERSVQSRDAAWSEACREYNRGAHDALQQRLFYAERLILRLSLNSFAFYAPNVTDDELAAGKAYLWCGNGRPTAQDYSEACLEWSIISYTGGGPV